MGAIGLLFSSLILLMLGRFVSSTGNYVRVLAAVVHASFIDKLLGNAVRAFLIVTRKSVMQTSTSLAMLFPKIELTSPAYIILGQIDLFQIWMFGVLAIGLSAVFKIEPAQVAVRRLRLLAAQERHLHRPRHHRDVVHEIALTPVRFPTTLHSWIRTHSAATSRRPVFRSSSA